MDDALALPSFDNLSRGWVRVLILVVMDDALALFYLKFLRKENKMS